MSKPEDYIDVSTLEPDINEKKTFSSSVRGIIDRFYEQEFTYLHVLAMLQKLGLYNYTRDLRTKTKDTVWSLYKQGELKIVSRGERQNGQLTKFKSAKY